MNPDDLHKNYRPNIGITLFNRDGAVFYGRRMMRGGTIEDRVGAHRWQMPQGGIDKGEAPITAAYRELKEETGVASAQLLTITPGWLTYDFPENYKRKNWRGQRQKWAAMLFTGEASEINLSADDHQEFDDWRWGDLEEAPSLIVPFKRNVYEELMAAFLPLRDYIRSL
ncbi:MAG: RNA pyrophosphohydrolase [Pseudomonadota bacterium]